MKYELLIRIWHQNKQEFYDNRKQDTRIPKNRKLFRHKPKHHTKIWRKLWTVDNPGTEKPRKKFGKTEKPHWIFAKTEKTVPKIA